MTYKLFLKTRKKLKCRKNYSCIFSFFKNTIILGANKTRFDSLDWQKDGVGYSVGGRGVETRGGDFADLVGIVYRQCLRGQCPAYLDDDQDSDWSG